MSVRELSPREEEIVQLCMEGFTNESIADKLGLSVGTVNTYWLRIKLKVGGSGRTDTVVRIIKDRAEKALREANTERQGLAKMVEDQDQRMIELRAALALLHLAMDQIKSTVWAVDTDLEIYVIANGEYPSTHFGVTWEVGKSIYDIFKTSDPEHPAVAAHLNALEGKGGDIRLGGEFENMFLRVLPLHDEADTVVGCISILNTVNTEWRP